VHVGGEVEGGGVGGGGGEVGGGGGVKACRSQIDEYAPTLQSFKSQERRNEYVPS
jgi:hypothetical protein